MRRRSQVQDIPSPSKSRKGEHIRRRSSGPSGGYGPSCKPSPRGAKRSGERVARAQRAPGDGQRASNSRLPVLQLGKDHAKNALFVSQNLGIPESQHTIAGRAERGIARAVPGIIRVLSAINFDDESFLATNEVNDVRIGGLLANEFETTQPSVAQRKPQLGFSVGALPAKASLQSNLPSLRSAHRSAPHPPRRFRGSAPSPRFAGRGKSAWRRSSSHHAYRTVPVPA
jgi:hypothetical protein